MSALETHWLAEWQAGRAVEAHLTNGEILTGTLLAVEDGVLEVADSLSGAPVLLYRHGIVYLTDARPAEQLRQESAPLAIDIPAVTVEARATETAAAGHAGTLPV